MEVEVRLFAMLRERAGTDAVTVELPEDATVRDALNALGRRRGLAELLAAMPVVMAVNREYAAEDDPLSAGDELALIPPVSGGAAEATGEGYESFMELGRVGRLVCDARVVHMARSVVFEATSLTDGEGSVIATSTATARVVKRNGA